MKRLRDELDAHANLLKSHNKNQNSIYQSPSYLLLLQMRHVNTGVGYELWQLLWCFLS